MEQNTNTKFCAVEAYFFENHCPMISKAKKVFRSIHGGSLNLCKCRRARIKGSAGRIWPAGRSLPMSGLEPSTVDKALKTKTY